MSAPHISIIVAVYNAEPYLRQCLDSLISQSHREIEIICVDDASTDRSRAVILEYAARDVRVRTVDNPKNEGVSTARNAGMDVARGNYLLFVDADDHVHPELCSKVLSCAAKVNADLVFFGFVKFSGAGVPLPGVTSADSLACVNPLDKQALLRLRQFACTKLIRRQKVVDLGLRFPDGMVFEDIPFHWMLVVLVDAIALLPEDLYFYRQRKGSLSGRTDWKLTDFAFVYDRVRDMLLKNGLFDKYRDSFLGQELTTYYTIYDRIAPVHRHAFWALFTKKIRAMEWQRISTQASIDWRVRDFYHSAEGSILARARRALWLFARGCYRATKR